MLQNNYQQDNEHLELATLQERVHMCKSEAWKDYAEMLKGLVEEAHEALVGCVSGDPQVYMRLVIRYQQRIGVKRESDRWAESAEQGLNAIIEGMRQDLTPQEPNYV